MRLGISKSNFRHFIPLCYIVLLCPINLTLMKKVYSYTFWHSKTIVKCKNFLINLNVEGIIRPYGSAIMFLLMYDGGNCRLLWDAQIEFYEMTNGLFPTMHSRNLTKLFHLSSVLHWYLQWCQMKNYNLS